MLVGISRRHARFLFLLTRNFSSSSSSSSDASPPTTVWQRQAIRVKDKDINNNYLEAIRVTHDPSQHIKTIEDELMSTIGQALGRQGHKILSQLNTMKDLYEQYIQQQQQGDSERIVKEYNAARERALQARWELTVHRQAAGFLVNNHEFVAQQYPIPPKLVLTDNEASQQEQQQKKQFTTQQHWWQTVGRWR